MYFSLVVACDLSLGLSYFPLYSILNKNYEEYERIRICRKFKK